MDLESEIRAHFLASKLPPPSQAWLQAIISARNPPPPMPSLVMTAKTRLLVSDITTQGLLEPTKIPTLCFPNNISNQSLREWRLGRDVYVQVVDVENLSKSRWEQAEEMEAIERGEQTRGREIIRLPLGGNGEVDELVGAREDAVRQPDAAGSSKNATHRLVLQDCGGTKVFAVELTSVPRVAIGTLNIGEKILLNRETVVARGTLLLKPSTCYVLGGKIEAWQKSWLDDRLVRLKESISTYSQT